MNYEEVKKRIETWDTGSHGKTTRERKMYMLGMAAGADTNAGQFDELFKIIMAHRKKRTTKPKPITTAVAPEGTPETKVL